MLNVKSFVHTFDISQWPLITLTYTVIILFTGIYVETLIMFIISHNNCRYDMVGMIWIEMEKYARKQINVYMEHIVSVNLSKYSDCQMITSLVSTFFRTCLWATCWWPPVRWNLYLFIYFLPSWVDGLTLALALLFLAAWQDHNKIIVRK